MTIGQRRAVFALAGLVVGGVGVAVPVMRGSHTGAALAELAFLAVAAVAAGLWLSFVTPSRSGSIVVINPAVCFTFALMLSWGIVAALGAHVASLAVLALRWRLSPTRTLLLMVQSGAAYAAAYGVLHADGVNGPPGREWTALHDAGIVIAATAVWLAVYLVVAFLFSRASFRGRTTGIRALSRTGLLFNGALVVLSPGVALTADADVALAVLFLVPLYATQRMARLSVERERADRVDSLTLLANRTALRERFDRQVRARQGQAQGDLALLLLNLDRFKYINDSLGYEVGDRLLRSMASRLVSIHDGNHTVGRLTADEFVLLADLPDAASVDELAAEAVRVVRQPVQLSGVLVEITGSVGVAVRDRAADSFVEVLRHADAAMYEAKLRGNSAARYRGQGEHASAEGLRLLADFRSALLDTDSTEVALHYQPQMRLGSGAIEGLEALLRWTHPVRGPIDTMYILGLAEPTNIMQLLTTRVIDTVTAQLARWRQEGLALRVAVNVSARDLYRDDLVDQVADRLAHHDLPAYQFQVEVTESALTTDPVQARATLRQIAELGVGISLDDFGTGFSSLQQVRGTPLAEIKIDQAFVKGMNSNRDDAAIVASTISLAHSLGLRAVAEGVEDEPTLARLAGLGCELGQGWLIGHPVPADRVPALVSEFPRRDHHAR